MSQSELQNAIEQNARQPAQVSVDGLTARQHSLRDQIEADRYVESKKAVNTSGTLGVICKKLVPPGAG